MTRGLRRTLGGTLGRARRARGRGSESTQERCGALWSAPGKGDAGSSREAWCAVRCGRHRSVQEPSRGGTLGRAAVRIGAG